MKRCQGCGQELTGLPPSVLKRRKFCEWACRAEYFRGYRLSERVKLTCETCGDTFERLPKKSHQKYCSIGCRKPTVPKRSVHLSCEFCGKGVVKRPSEVAGGRGKFCSKRCAGLGRPINGRPSTIATQAIEVFLATSPHLVEVEKRVDRFSIDLAVPLLQLAIELDGVYWHSLPGMAEKDRRKDAALRADGWRVERIPIESDSTPDQLAKRIAAVIDAAAHDSEEMASWTR